ncbi:hypothetical protein L9F63_020222, partial [Diploptera punctata]
FSEQSKFQHWLQAMILRLMFSAACLILAIIIAPFIGVIMIILICYRKGIHFYLKVTQPHYVQLFEGLDAIWAVEEETSRSIINVLAFFEVEDLEEGKIYWIPSGILTNWGKKKTIVNRLATPPLPCEKLFYLRRQRFGYFYWEQQAKFEIEDYIRPMITIPPDYESFKYNSSQFPHRISEETLKNIVGELSNTKLPKDHEACWEILVGSQPMDKSLSSFSLDNFTNRLHYPVLFRIHHSLGDGIALMQLLVSVMTNNQTKSAGLHIEQSKIVNFQHKLKCLLRNRQLSSINQHQLALILVQKNSYKLPTSSDPNQKPEIFSKIIQTICALVLSPASLIHQVIMKATDRNVLHGPQLTGYKVIAWYRDQNGELFKQIKKVKNCFNIRFTEVLLTALSASLEKYFETHQVSYKDGIPGIVNIVIPARMEQPTSKFDLNNRFSVAMFQLPVSQAAENNNQGNEYNKFSLRNRLEAVCHNSEMLRNSIDYQVNYWLLKVVATYLTKSMLTAVARSSQSTLIVSNVMGPTKELNFAGSKLQDIFFWVPHRGTTGVGISVLSYKGHLQIGIMADRAVVHCKEDAQMIIDEMVAEMNKFDKVASFQSDRNARWFVNQIVTKSALAKSFN